MSLLVSSGGGGLITASDITDSSASGRTVLTGTASAAREVLGIATDAGGSQAAGYYVDSVNGDDTNSGRTSAAPLKTFAALVALGIADGSRIYLARGSYWREALNIWSKNNLSISDYGQGVIPTIDGSDNIANNTFVVNGTYSDVYQVAYTAPTTFGACQFAVWENDVAIRPFTSLAALHGSATGGFWLNGGVLYVKATDAGDVTANGKTYSAHGQRSYDGSGSYQFIVGNNCDVSFLRSIKPYVNDGSTFGRNCKISFCKFEHGTKHNFVVGSGVVSNCYAAHLVNSTWYQGSSNLGFYFNGAGVDDVVLCHCTIENDARVSGGNVFTAHADSGGSYGSIHAYGNTFKNVVCVFGNAIKTVTYERNIHVNVGSVCDAIYAGSSFISLRNYFDGAESGGWVYSISSSTALLPTVFKSYGDVYRAPAAANCSHFLTIQANAVSATVLIEGLEMQIGKNVPVIRTDAESVGAAISLIRSNVCGGAVSCNGGNNSLCTYTGSGNTFGSQAFNSWLGVSYSGQIAWRAGTSQDLDSVVARDRISSVSATVTIPPLAAGARSNTIPVTVPGALKTDAVLVRSTDYGQLFVWPLTDNNLNGIVNLYFRNDSTYSFTGADRTVYVSTYSTD